MTHPPTPPSLHHFLPLFLCLAFYPFIHLSVCSSSLLFLVSSTPFTLYVPLIPSTSIPPSFHPSSTSLFLLSLSFSLCLFLSPSPSMYLSLFTYISCPFYHPPLPIPSLFLSLSPTYGDRALYDSSPPCCRKQPSAWGPLTINSPPSIAVHPGTAQCGSSSLSSSRAFTAFLAAAPWITAQWNCMWNIGDRQENSRPHRQIDRHGDRWINQ